MKRFTPLLVLLFAGPCWGQSITLPPALTVPKAGLVTIKPASVDADSVAWVAIDDGLQLIDSTLLKDDKTAVGIALQPGTYRVRAVAAKVVGGKAALSPFSECVVTVGGVPPVPPGPTPPGPTPPGPAPIPGAGFRVMIVYESSDLNKLPAKQLDVLYAASVRIYLNTHTSPTSDGGKRGWYIADKDSDFSGESKVWQDALKRPRTQTPWLIVSNGTGGWEGPLPADIPATLEILKKYGGP